MYFLWTSVILSTGNISLCVAAQCTDFLTEIILAQSSNNRSMCETICVATIVGGKMLYKQTDYDIELLQIKDKENTY